MNVETAAPPAHARAMQIVQTAVAGKLVATLAEAGVPDAIGEGTQPTADIARATGLDQDALARALRAAALLGVVERTPDGLWRNTALGHTLRANVPGSLRDYVVYALHDGNWRAWRRLGATLRTGEPSFAEANDGQQFWDYFDAHPDVSAAFHRAMAAATAVAAREMPAAMRLERFAQVADIGGGSGVVLAEVLRAAPHLTGLLFERADVIDAARRYLAEQGVAERVTFEAGDVFAYVPQGADAYILKNILHDHAPQKCATILDVLHAAMRPDARLFVVEAVLPEVPAPHPAIWRDLHMMVALGGRERTETEWRALLGDHRFAIERIARLSGPDAVIEVRRV